MNSRGAEKMLQMDRRVPFVDCIFRIIDGATTESEAVDILRQAETGSGVELSSIYPYPAPRQIPAERYHEEIEIGIESLLNSTHLVLGTYHFCQLVTLFTGGVYQWGHREWGHIAARWANKTEWLGKKDWGYLDFYNGPNDRLIEGYNAWAETVMRVVRKKSAPRIQHLTPLMDEIIETLLRSSDEIVREGAAATLAGLGGEKAKAALEKAVATEKDQLVQNNIQLFLSGMK
jgi:hypothetical protein